MVYLSLYRKYRPQTFAEILGQEHVSVPLANAITEGRVAHAYLFTGPRGTGKTSTARILAKAINCEKGPTAEPCGKCDSCVAITQGSSLDVIEMDAASHSKVDETREILTGVPLATAGSRRKVYVIDEVHMLSAQAFSALLKTLEEPPSHVVFVLATTEAHKVLPTIVSRTQRFDFRPLPTDLLETHLAQVAKAESIDIATEAISVVARRAAGGARDALSALDQLASYGAHVSAADAERLLGRRWEEAFVDLFEAIASSDVGAVFWTLHSLIAQGADARQLAEGALEHTRSLLLLLSAPEAENLLEISAEDRARLGVQAQRFTAGQLVRVMDLISTSLVEMRNSSNHRLLLEIALVRAAAPDTDPSARGLLGRIERLERRAGIEGSVGEIGGDVEPIAPSRDATSRDAPSRDAPTRPSRSTPTRKPQSTVPRAQPQTAAVAEKASTPAPDMAADKTSAAAPDVAPEMASVPPSGATADKTSVPAQDMAAAVPDQVVAPASVGLGHVKDAWKATMAEVNKRDRKVGAYLNPSMPIDFDGNVVTVEVQASFHVEAMNNPDSKHVLSDSLYAALGIRPLLGFVERDQARARHTPLDPTVDLAESTTATAVADDPVELVKKGLGAEVVEEIEQGG